MRIAYKSYWLLFLCMFTMMCNQCSPPRMGTRYCVKGGCKSGYGEQKVDFFGPEQGDKFRGYAIYKGEFREGLQWGRGTYEKRTKSIEGENYEGEFLNDNFHGYGKWEKLRTSPWPKEELDSCPWKYEGEFKAGVPNGQGTLTMRTGKVYSGIFGKTYYIGGLCYEGNCENGKGSVIHWNGLHYRGEFKNRNWNGQGTEYDANNHAKYVGSFKDGRYEGYGVQIRYSNTSLYKNGKWHDPEPYVRYEGMFVDGYMNGYGKLIFPGDGPDGTDRVQEGEWDGKHHCSGPKCNGALKPPSEEEWGEDANQ